MKKLVIVLALLITMISTGLNKVQAEVTLTDPEIPQICITGITLTNPDDREMCRVAIEEYNTFLVDNNYVPDYCFLITALTEYQQEICDESVIPLYCYDDGIISPQMKETCDNSFTNARQATNNYTYAVMNSDYDRIFIDHNGLWHGIIEITGLKISQPWTLLSGNVRYTVIDLKLNRDLKELISVTYDYEIDAKCPNLEVPLVGWCIGGKVKASSGTNVAYNKETDGSFLEFVNITERIITSPDDNYDYRIRTFDTDIIDRVSIVSFEMILTNAEVDDLNLDIQSQFNEEVAIINNNVLLSSAQKQVQIEALIEEYIDYHIEYDEVLNTIAQGVTEAELEDSCDVACQIETFIVKALLIVGGTVLGGVLLTLLIKYLINLGVFTFITGVKGTVVTGNYMGDTLWHSTKFFLDTLWNGITNIFTRK